MEDLALLRPRGAWQGEARQSEGKDERKRNAVVHDHVRRSVGILLDRKIRAD